jgi:hypothetical protein
MKAMLDARIVAVRIHGASSSLHGTAAGADRPIVSDGVLIVTRMGFQRFRLLKFGLGQK